MLADEVARICSASEESSDRTFLRELEALLRCDRRRKALIHPTAEVKTTRIGTGTDIWQHCVVLEDAVLGNDCNVNAYCFIENDVAIGDRVTIKCGVYIWDGITIEDDVFVGPNVTFSNDKYPRSKHRPENFMRTTIKRGASIGAGAVLLPGITVGESAMIGAGAVVTKDVRDGALVLGNPAKEAVR